MLVYPICCGVDVHKNTIVATIAVTDKNHNTDYTTKSFSTLTPELLRFRSWLEENQCQHVCMESTGKYWIPIYNVLEDKFHVILTHPKYVRSIKGQKTDKKDSKWITNVFMFDLVRASYIPNAEVRALRDLARYRFKLVCMRSSEKNRYQNSMTVSNIGLSSVLTDPFCKTATNIMEYLLSSQKYDEEFCKTLILHTAKKKTQAILESVQHSRIEPDQHLKMTLAYGHICELNNYIVHVEAEIFKRMQPHYEQVRLLSSQLPGITELSAALILCEIGFDLSPFENQQHFVSWAGLSPTNNESANKKKSVRISKAGQYLKPLLVQCALAAIKSKTQPYFAIKYAAIKRRRGHKKAIIAIARMVAICIFNMLSNGECFNPSDLDNVLSHPNPNRKPVLHSVDDALNFLITQGYDVSSLAKVDASVQSVV
jgi:transposase